MRRLLLGLVLLAGASAADAGNPYFYVGGGISKDKLSDIVNAGTNFADIDNTSWKLFAGLRPVSLFAVEADYLDLGSQTSTFVSTTTRSDAKAFAGYAVGFLPIPLPFLDVFGKAGLARWKLNGSALSPVSPPSSFSNNGTEFAWGVGTQVHVGNFGARLEYENFRIPSTNGADVVSLEVFLNIF